MKLHEKYTKAIKDLSKPMGGGLKVELAEVVEKSKVPKKIVEATDSSNPIITKTPPFDSSWSYLEWWYKGGHGSPDFITFLDRMTGMIGDRAESANVSEYVAPQDYWRVNYDTSMGFVKNTYPTGKWDVWLTIRGGDVWCNRCFDTWIQVCAYLRSSYELVYLVYRRLVSRR